MAPEQPAERGTLLPLDDCGQPQLPKKAERVWGKPGKKDLTGHYLDQETGQVKTVIYRLPEPKQPVGRVKNGGAAEAPEANDAPAKTRPEVTQKGNAMIGDFRTDALHQALREAAIDDSTLLALLVLALGADNVSVQSGTDLGTFEREKICVTIAEGGVLTSDLDLVRNAARSVLIAALSCRDNQSNSGVVARVAGDAVGASHYLPNMATAEFLASLSRAALEKSAAAEGVRVEARVQGHPRRTHRAVQGRHLGVPGRPVPRHAGQARDIPHTVCVTRRLLIAGILCRGGRCKSRRTGAAKS